MKGICSIIFVLFNLFLAKEMLSVSPNDLLDAIHNGKADKIKKWGKTKEIVPVQPCNLRLTDQIKTVSYFELRCGSKRSHSLIQFGTKGKVPMFFHSFQIKDYKKIGNKIYTEITISSNNNHDSNQTFSYSDGKNQAKLKKYELRENSNQNLATFLQLAQSQSSTKKIESPMQIFFDKSCPLRYISPNHDFYWDNIILHEFEITCLSNQSLNYLIRIQGNKFGQIPVGNIWVSDIKSGTLLLAHIKLNDWEGERLVWSDPLFYYEN